MPKESESFRPKFTTSQEAQDEKREQREATLGPNFHDRVKTVTNSTPPCKSKSARMVKPSPDGKLFYNRLPPKGTDAREELDRKELAAKMELEELHNKLQQDNDPKFQAAQAALKKHIRDTSL